MANTYASLLSSSATDGEASSAFEIADGAKARFFSTAGGKDASMQTSIFYAQVEVASGVWQDMKVKGVRLYLGSSTDCYENSALIEGPANVRWVRVGRTGAAGVLVCHA